VERRAVRPDAGLGGDENGLKRRPMYCLSADK
jgi:hypothetical protein